MKAAIGYIDTNWNAACDMGWLDFYQGMFTMTKGLQAYDIDLLPVNGDWFDQTSDYMVANQNGDGSWGTACGWGAGDPVLETSWALLSLEPFIFELPPLGPPVGGITWLAPDGSDVVAGPADGSGSSAPLYAVIAGAAAAAVAMMATGGWYARRRWLS